MEPVIYAGIGLLILLIIAGESSCRPVEAPAQDSRHGHGPGRPQHTVRGRTG